MVSQPSITCPQCGMTSYHPMDIEKKYCGNCHQFHNAMGKQRLPVKMRYKFRTIFAPDLSLYGRWRYFRLAIWQLFND